MNDPLPITIILISAIYPLSLKDKDIALVNMKIYWNDSWQS